MASWPWPAVRVSYPWRCKCTCMTRRRLSSSSTTRMRAVFICLFFGSGEFLWKAASTGRVTFQRQFTSVLLHNLVGDREAQTSAVLLGCVERIENVVYLLRGDARAGIADSQDEHAVALFSRDRHLASVRHRLYCVQHQ